MTLQNSYITIDNLRLYAHHGVVEQERHIGADFSVSLRVHYYIYKAMHTDDVKDTLNYAELCSIVKEQMAIPSRLLEHAAGRICKAVLDRYPEADDVWLKLTKLNPPMGADSDGASVELEVRSDK